MTIDNDKKTSVKVLLDISTEDFTLLKRILEERQIPLNEFVEEFIAKQIETQKQDYLKQMIIKDILLDPELSMEYISYLHSQGILVCEDVIDKTRIYNYSNDSLLKYLKTETLKKILKTILLLNANRRRPNKKLTS